MFFPFLPSSLLVICCVGLSCGALIRDRMVWHPTYEVSVNAGPAAAAAAAPTTGKKKHSRGGGRERGRERQDGEWIVVELSTPFTFAVGPYDGEMHTMRQFSSCSSQMSVSLLSLSDSFFVCVMRCMCAFVRLCVPLVS